MSSSVDFLIYVNTGTEATPEYTKVAGQRGGSLNRDVETIDKTTKDSGGWTESGYGNGSWTIEGDGLLTEGDTGFTALEDAYMNRAVIMVRFQTASGTNYEGDALITSLPIEAPYEDDVTYSITLQGTGALTKA